MLLRMRFEFRVPCPKHTAPMGGAGGWVFTPTAHVGQPCGVSTATSARGSATKNRVNNSLSNRKTPLLHPPNPLQICPRMLPCRCRRSTPTPVDHIPCQDALKHQRHRRHGDRGGPQIPLLAVSTRDPFLLRRPAAP